MPCGMSMGRPTEREAHRVKHLEVHGHRFIPEAFVYLRGNFGNAGRPLDQSVSTWIPVHARGLLASVCLNPVVQSTFQCYVQGLPKTALTHCHDIALFFPNAPRVRVSADICPATSAIHCTEASSLQITPWISAGWDAILSPPTVGSARCKF